MSDSKEEAKKRLRKYLSPAIKGKNVDIILEALASGPSHLIQNVEAVYDQLYIVTATGLYLDQLMAGRGLTRPDAVGLPDSIFRDIGIQVTTKKQIRSLILEILRTIYGEEFTRATMNSPLYEPYSLEDGDTLIVQYDDSESYEVKFSASQFSNIAFATAQEVADAITKGLRSQGATGSAAARDDGTGVFVQLISDTDGPSSSVRVLGGKAQNALKFPVAVPTSGDATTQWTLSIEPGGAIKATWTGGANPNIGKIQPGNYVNIYSTGLANAKNKGTFTVLEAVGGTAGNSYFTYYNPEGVAETFIQGTNDGVLFFNPKRNTLNDKKTFATVYQVESRTLEIFIPAITRVVRRDRIGSAHLYSSGASIDEDYGPYIYDLQKPYLIDDIETTTTQIIDSSTTRVITVTDSSQFPDEFGYIILNHGEANEEGPIPYIGRPATNNLLIDPAYTFKKTHANGASVTHVSQNYSYIPRTDGKDYQFYLTDTVSGRLYAKDLIDLIVATGINVIVTILYPDNTGLANYLKEGDAAAEQWKFVWGEDR